MENIRFPFYLKLSATLISIVLLLLLLYIGKPILVPLFFASFFCIFLIKPCNFLERHGFHHAVAAAVCMIAAIGVAATVIYFISSQLVSFKDQIPTLEQNLNNGFARLQVWMQQRFHITHRKMDSSIQDLRTKAMASVPSLLGSTFSTLSGILEYAVLIPIYTFLLLLYRRLIKRFINLSFSEKHKLSVSSVLNQTQYVIRSYIAGLLLEMLIVAIMVYAGLLIVGAPYALLIAFIVAVLNLIPYLGVFIGCIITLIITASTEPNTFTVLGSVIVIVITHIIDSNIVFPRIVGSKVKINALVTIAGVIIGGAIWSIPGMFLAIPVIALLKVFFDEVEELRPWGILLGEDEEKPHKNKLAALKNKFKKRKKAPEQPLQRNNQHL